MSKGDAKVKSSGKEKPGASSKFSPLKVPIKWDDKLEPVTMTICGMTCEMKHPVLKDPFKRVVLQFSGTNSIAGPVTPSVKTFENMLLARVRAGLLAQEAYESMLEGTRAKQVASMASDLTGSVVTEEIAKAASAQVHMFVRDSDGHLALESRAIKAMIREAFGTENFWRTNQGAKEDFTHNSAMRPVLCKITRNGKPLVDADAIYTHPVNTYVRGMRVASIAECEVVNPPWEIVVVYEVNENAKFPIEKVIEVMKHAPTLGLGALRSFGFGSCILSMASDVMVSDGEYSMTSDKVFNRDTSNDDHDVRSDEAVRAPDEAYEDEAVAS